MHFMLLQLSPTHYLMLSCALTLSHVHAWVFITFLHVWNPCAYPSGRCWPKKHWVGLSPVPDLVWLWLGQTLFILTRSDSFRLLYGRIFGFFLLDFNPRYPRIPSHHASSLWYWLTFVLRVIGNYRQWRSSITCYRWLIWSP